MFYFWQLMRKINANYPPQFTVVDKVGTCLGPSQKVETVVEKLTKPHAVYMKGLTVITSQESIAQGNP